MSSHSQTCKSCNAEITGDLYHLGLSHLDAVNCERCPNVLLLKVPQFYQENGITFPALLPGDDGWEPYDRHLLPCFEQAEYYFPLCSCGGRFRYMAAPRCPDCNGYLSGRGYDDKPALRDTHYVFVTSKSIYL